MQVSALLLLLFICLVESKKPSSLKLKSRGELVNRMAKDNRLKNPSKPAIVAVEDSTSILNLLFGAGGIYACYLYYGTLQEEVTSFVSASGEKFKAPWMLNSIEAIANVVLGGIGLYFQGATKNLPYKLFGFSGTFQVMAKAFTTQALSNGGTY